VFGMALFIGIYAYALSTEPLPGGDGPRPPSRARTKFAQTRILPSHVMEMLP
jgi:hypothetical protein